MPDNVQSVHESRTEIRSRRTQEKKQDFLERFTEAGTVQYAAALAGVGRRTVYEWLEADPIFAAEFKRAEEDVADKLEAEAIRRACEGIDKPVYYQGQKVDTYKEKSDTLLIFLLKGQKPEKYGDKVRQEHTGAGGGPIRVDFGVSRPTGRDSVIQGAGQKEQKDQFLLQNDDKE